MDNPNTAPEAVQQEPSSVDNRQPNAPLQFLKLWDGLWARLTKLGMGNIALRVGSALVTIGLVGLVIWVMKGFFITSEMANLDAEALDFAAGGAADSTIGLPAYQGVAPVGGISRSAESNTYEPPTPRYAFEMYTVVAGDTIWDISQKYGLKPETLLWTNPDSLYDNPAFIVPGQQVRIPPEDGVLYFWHEGDGLNGVASGLNVTPEDIINWPGNNLNPETIGDYASPNIAVDTMIFAPGGSRGFYDWTEVIFRRDKPAESLIWGEGKCEPSLNGPVGTGVYVWPTSERRISGYQFDPSINHWGIDIGGKIGNPIYTVDNGVVVYAGWSDWGYGNVIAVDHGETQSLYAHLDSLNVGCGDFVYQGDLIGFMGSTGNSSGPHLHFELRSGSTRMNPNKYLTP